MPAYIIYTSVLLNVDPCCRRAGKPFTLFYRFSFIYLYFHLLYAIYLRFSLMFICFSINLHDFQWFPIVVYDVP